MSDTEYGLRRRATEISSDRKRQECEKKQEVVAKAGAVMALAMLATAEAKFEEEFEPQPQPGGLRAFLFDLKRWVSGVVSRD